LVKKLVLRRREVFPSKRIKEMAKERVKILIPPIIKKKLIKGGNLKE